MPFFLKSCLKLRRGQKKKNKNLNQKIKPISDITTSIRIDSVVHHCKSQSSTSNLNQCDGINNSDCLVANKSCINKNSKTDLEESYADDEINYSNNLVANNVCENSEISLKGSATVEFSRDDFHPHNSDVLENKRQADIRAEFKLNDSNEPPQDADFKLLDSLKKSKKNKKKNKYCEDKDSQSSEDSEHNTLKSRFANCSVCGKESKMEKNKKIDPCMTTPLCDIITTQKNENVIQQFKTKLNSLNFNKDDEMNDSDLSVASNQSEKDATENVKEVHRDYDVPFDDFDTKIFKDSESTNQEHIWAELHLNDSEEPLVGTTVKTADSKETNSKNIENWDDFYTNANSNNSEVSKSSVRNEICEKFPFNDSSRYPEGTVVKTMISKNKKSKKKKISQSNKQFNDITTSARNDHFTQKCDKTRTYSNLNEEKDMNDPYYLAVSKILHSLIGLVEAINSTIDNFIKLYNRGITFGEDVDVAVTHQKNTHSHTTTAIDSNISHSSFTSSQPPNCSEDALSALLESKDNKAISTNNISAIYKQEKQDSHEPLIFVSTTSTVDSTGRNQEDTPHESKAQKKSSKIMNVEIDKHRHADHTGHGNHNSNIYPETQSEIFEVDSTSEIQANTCNIYLIQVLQECNESSLKTNEMINRINSESIKKERENKMLSNIEIQKLPGIINNNSTVLTNTIEFASEHNDECKYSEEKEHNVQKTHNTNNDFLDKQLTYETNVTLNAKNSTASIFQDASMQLDCMSTILEAESVPDEPTEFRIMESAELKDEIDLAAYQAPELLKSETAFIQNVINDHIPENQSNFSYLILPNTIPDVLSINKVTNTAMQLEYKNMIPEQESFSAESKSILSPDMKEDIELNAYQAPETRKTDSRSAQDHISEKHSKVSYLIVNTTPDELLINKIPSNAVQKDSLNSHAECSEFIDIRNSVTSSKSETNLSFISQMKKIYAENNAPDNISEEITTTNDLFDEHGKGDSSKKNDYNYNLKFENNEIFNRCLENKEMSLLCEQKEKLESEFELLNVETNFMNLKENLKDVEESKTDQSLKNITFNSKTKEVIGKDLYNMYNTDKKENYNHISLKSIGDVPFYNEDLTEFETVLHNSQDKSSKLCNQLEIKSFGNNVIFDEKPEIQTEIVRFVEKGTDELYVDDKNDSETHITHFNDSFEGKLNKHSLMNFENSNSAANTESKDSSLSDEINKMCQNSADSLFVNVQSYQDDNVISEVLDINKNSTKSCSTSVSNDTISTYSSQEAAKCQSQHSSLRCFHDNCQQMVNEHCSQSKQNKFDSFRNTRNKENNADNVASYTNQNIFFRHSMVSLDSDCPAEVSKYYNLENSQYEYPEDNFLVEEIPKNIPLCTLQNHKTELIFENNQKMKSAGKCSLPTESSAYESKGTKMEELYNECSQDFISTNKETCRKEEIFSDDYQISTLSNVEKNQLNSEKNSKLKNTFTIKKERLFLEENNQKLEFSKTKPHWQKGKGKTTKNGTMHRNNKHTQICKKFQSKEDHLGKSSTNIEKFSRSRKDKTKSMCEKASSVENKMPKSFLTDNLHKSAAETSHECSEKMTPIRKKILDYSRSIRSPKCPSPLKNKRNDTKEMYMHKPVFLKSTNPNFVTHLGGKEKQIHHIKGPLKIPNKDDFISAKAAFPRKRLTEDGHRHQIQHTQNYRAKSPEDLKPKFDDEKKEKRNRIYY